MKKLLTKSFNWFLKILYAPLCRAYARYIVGDKPADSVMRFLCGLQFWHVHNFWPDFKNPQRFSEKVWFDTLNNRDPILTLISDKFRVRDYVIKKVGGQYLIPLLWHGDDPEQIPFKNLPDKFVIKTNHGCGYNIIVRDKTKLDINLTKQKIRKWLGENFGRDKYLGIAWGYKDVRPTIIIETFMDDNGKAPVDYKFYCFSGHVEVLSLHFDRFEGHKTRAFDRNFEPREFRYDFEQWSGDCQRPPYFEEMVQLAESLAQGFDFMRVDLYGVKNNIYFSELTPYPGGVSTKFLPVNEDRVLGEKWKLNK